MYLISGNDKKHYCIDKHGDGFGYCKLNGFTCDKWGCQKYRVVDCKTSNKVLENLNQKWTSKRL
jgi:hypothetical protein